MAEGETVTSKWLVSCAIDILIDERSTLLNSMLSSDDLFMLWARPLLKEAFSKEVLLSKAQKLEKNKSLIDRITQFNQMN